MEDNLIFVEGYVIKYLHDNINILSNELKVQLNYLDSQNLKYFFEIIISGGAYSLQVNEMDCNLEFIPDKEFLRYVRKEKLKRIKDAR